MGGLILDSEAVTGLARRDKRRAARFLEATVGVCVTDPVYRPNAPSRAALGSVMA